MRRLEVLILALILVPLATTPAHAYLDANSGDFVVQAICGGLAGIALILRLAWHLSVDRVRSAVRHLARHAHGLR